MHRTVSIIVVLVVIFSIFFILYSPIFISRTRDVLRVLWFCRFWCGVEEKKSHRLFISLFCRPTSIGKHVTRFLCFSPERPARRVWHTRNAPVQSVIRVYFFNRIFSVFFFFLFISPSRFARKTSRSSTVKRRSARGVKITVNAHCLRLNSRSSGGCASRGF